MTCGEASKRHDTAGGCTRYGAVRGRRVPPNDVDVGPKQYFKTLSNRTSGCEELVDHVDGDHPNGGHGHHDSDDMSPGGEAVVDVLHGYIGDDVEQDHTHGNEGGSHSPADFPQEAGIKPKHILQVLIEPVHTI